MLAVKLKGTVTADHRLEITMPSTVPPGEVEVIILHAERRAKPKGHVRLADPHAHPAAGMWADRKDIDDTVTFVTQLRHRLETRD